MSSTYTTTGKHLSPASFWAPHFLEASAWADHAPFAFWLIEHHKPRTLVELGTHGGYSYFAFCQAVKAFSLSTQCYAVDTWRGDEHTGFYDEAFFQQVSEYNDAHYAAFSRLVRSTFDEAVEHFSDGSIDLLHIDGLHFYEDVKHDFETWRPKLSERAIILFHDTNVRERNFGVFRLWDELRTEFPSFEFLHGHGLGVLGFGSDLPPNMVDFFTAVRESNVPTDIRHAYSRLGGAFKADLVGREIQIQLKGEITAQKERADALDVNLKTSESEVRRLTSRETALMAESSALEDSLKEAGRRLEVQWEHNSILTAQVDDLTRQLNAQKQALQSLKNSTSWRLTAPIRIARRFPKRVTQTIRHLTKASARLLYHHIPLPQVAKKKLVDVSFRIAPTLFQSTSVYRKWESRRRRESADALLLQRQKPLKEVARPFEIDYSVAVPFDHAQSLTNAPKLAVICHLFYESMAPEFQRYLANISFPFDLFISTNTAAKKAALEAFFKDWSHGSVEIRITENRGRDIAPKLLTFKDIYDSHEYVLHIHSKASDHASALANWRGFLLENLLGSPEIVNSVFSAFYQRPDLGIIASQHFEPMRHWVNWGGNFKAADALARRMGIVMSDDKVLDFPSGSMFWARSSALKPLLDLNLEFDDFDKENKQIDGTLAHAIERLYFYVCERASFKWIKISHPSLFEHTPAIISIDSPGDLDKFMSEHTLTLTDPTTPAPRTIHPPPVAPAKSLIARLQERALGSKTPVNAATNVVVGIVTYNNTAKQVRSIVNSARQALIIAGLTAKARIYVVDNGDASSAAAGEDESIFHMKSEGNVGFGKAHNRLMTEAFSNNADIYIAANPDGSFHPDAIGALVQMMHAHNGRALIEAIQFPDEHPKTYDPFTFETPWASGACLAIPNQLYEAIGGFDDAFFMYCEDVDLSWRARASGFAVRICPRALFLHAVTNRKPDPTRLKVIFNSGILLARKWNNPKFEKWLNLELKAIGFEPTDAQPTRVPDEWGHIPDFDHQLSFSETRW